MHDFKKMVEDFEILIQQINYAIQNKNSAESIQLIEDANLRLSKLEQLVDGEVQNKIFINRKRKIESLLKQNNNILSKRELGKKEDGNIALKCNWNDKNYSAPCSLEAYNFNLAQGKSWCSSPQNNCRDFGEQDASLENHPCYESIAFKDMYFGAGVDNKTNKPRHIYSAKVGRMALLTTVPPGSKESDRIILGLIFIKKIDEDPGKETKIFGDKSKSIVINYNTVKIKFWDYYENPKNKSMIRWSSGLFRYISDDIILRVLIGIKEKYNAFDLNCYIVNDLIACYQEQEIIKFKSSKN